MGRADLHTHSTASDGACAPPEVTRRAVAAGLDAIALTDHDTVAGVAAAREAAAGNPLRIIAGCEFSVQVPWGELHLLGYFLPAGDARLERFLALQRERRAVRMEEIVRRLAAAGVAVSLEEITAQAAGAALGRPHAARAVVRAGAARDVNQAFHRFLGRGRPAFVPKELPAVTDTARLVRAVAGVTSAAHLKDRGGRSVLRMLREVGVDAVEVRHPAHDDATEARLGRLADEEGLLRSGGSDWHGDARAASDGRADLGAVHVPLEWLEDLERLHLERREATTTS